MYLSITYLFTVILVIAVTGCTPYIQHIQPKSQMPEPGAMVKRVTELTDEPNRPAGSGNFLNLEEPKDDLTLKQALSLALTKNPELAAYSWEIRAMEAKVLQEGLLPNPEIDMEIENLGGTGDFKGAGLTETTVRLSQLIQTGGKRRKRRYMASLQHGLSRWDYEIKSLNILTETTIAFIDVLAAQKKLAISEKVVSLAEQVHHTVSERVKAGKVPPVEKTKTDIALSVKRIQMEGLRRKLDAAKKVLSSAWGSISPVFKKAKGDLSRIFPVPPLEKLTGFIEKHPEAKRRSMEIEKEEAALEYAKAAAIPDLTISGGIRHFSEKGNSAFVLGISAPLPFFSRNQGGIMDARYRLAKAKEKKRAAKVTLYTSLYEIYQTLSSSFSEAEAWRKHLLPLAKDAFEAVKEGYRYGKFGLMDVLDAQRTLFEANSRYVETLAKYHKGAAMLEGLTGVSLKRLTDKRTGLH